ncbi:MAG: metallophosphoesterase family protein [Rhodovibrionaceae bacterium]|nr:metallophosphoesterase family protein [Rhodovibrionaceae bacterium]
MDSDTLQKLERRLGRRHARQRLGIERDAESRAFGQGLNFFHIENWYSAHAVIRLSLMMSGLYWRGRRNAERVRLTRHEAGFTDLPRAFQGFRILHISDLHVEMNPVAMQAAARLAKESEYDICVMTGDFRANTYGPFDEMMEGLAKLREAIDSPVYAVLGNHDSILMVPAMEEIGIRVLVNECELLERDGQRLFLAGIDDAHFFRVDNIEKVAEEVPDGDFAILLSHTPEVYRQAAHADFRLMLSGHTHGGQICLPGSVPVTLDAKLPRHMGAGAWRYHELIGYTSVGAGSCIVPVRLNCPPEITLHTLNRIEGPGDKSGSAQ